MQKMGIMKHTAHQGVYTVGAEQYVDRELTILDYGIQKTSNAMRST